MHRLRTDLRPGRTARVVREMRESALLALRPGERVALPAHDLQGREPTMWRYREVLPIRTRRTSSASAKASPRCWPRRGSPPSSASPTCASRTEPRTRPAVSKRGAWWLRFPRARELGARVVAAPSAGNAGGALAGYAARPAGPDEAPGFEQLDVLAANPSSRCTDPDGVKGERHQVSRSFNRNWCWETGRPQFQLKLLSAEVSSTCPQVPRVVSCGFRHGATG